MDIHYFDAPCGVTFKLVLSRSTYSIEVTDRDGKRLRWTGRQRGAALTDSLMMAAHYGEPLRASDALWYLFGRIDYYVDGPGVVDLWDAAVLRGQTVEQRDAARRARVLRELPIHTPTPHVDAIPNMEARAMAPAGTIAALIEAGEIVHTFNACGQPAIALVTA